MTNLTIIRGSLYNVVQCTVYMLSCKRILVKPLPATDSNTFYVVFFYRVAHSFVSVKGLYVGIPIVSPPSPEISVYFFPFFKNTRVLVLYTVCTLGLSQKKKNWTLFLQHQFDCCKWHSVCCLTLYFINLKSFKSWLKTHLLFSSSNLNST